MNLIYLGFLSLLITTVSFSQTGTIKIARPPAEQKDTLTPLQPLTATVKAIGLSVAGNYSFKDINKVGFEAEASFPVIFQIFYLGLKYSKEFKYYSLQPYNPETTSEANHYSRSINESDYIKMPIAFNTFLLDKNASIATGASNQREVCLSFGIAPEYLLKTSDQHGRLNYRDFKKFNLSAFAAFGFPIRKTNFSVNLGYSRDFFNNLKDNNIYNTNGAVLGKRSSRSNLTTLSLTYRIRYASAR